MAGRQMGQSCVRLKHPETVLRRSSKEVVKNLALTEGLPAREYTAPGHAVAGERGPAIRVAQAIAREAEEIRPEPNRRRQIVSPQQRPQRLKRHGGLVHRRTYCGLVGAYFSYCRRYPSSLAVGPMAKNIVF